MLDCELDSELLVRLGLSCGLFCAPFRFAPFGVEPESAKQIKITEVRR